MTKTKFIPLALILLNFGMKLLYADSQSISLDEAFSVFHSQADIHTIVFQLSKGNNPPLYEILLHYWVVCFGISIFSIRFLSVVFSSLSVLFIYLIGSRFFSRRVAITASLLFTFSNYEMFFAHEARVYPLFLLFSAISMYAFLSVIDGRKIVLHLILLTISNVVLAYSHFFGVIIPFLQIICLLFLSREKKVMSLFIGFSILIFLLCYSPYIAILCTRFSMSRSGTWLPPVHFDAAYEMIRSFSNQPLVAVFFMIIMAASLIKLYIHRKEFRPVHAKIIALWFFFPFVVMFMISLQGFPHGIPVFLDRYLIFISIPFYLVVAIAADYISKANIFNIFLLVLTVSMMTFTFDPDPNSRLHIREAVAKVKELKSPSSVVYLHPFFCNTGFAYYYDINLFKRYNTRNDDIYEKLKKGLAQENVFEVADYRSIDTTRCDAADKIIYMDLMADKTVDSVLIHRYGEPMEYSFPLLCKIKVYKK